MIIILFRWCGTGNDLADLSHTCPYPAFGKFGEVGGVGRGGFFVFAAAGPVLASGFEDAFEQVVSGFEFVFVFCALVGGEFAGDGGFEDGLAILR